jgi:phosphoadenosine phosphosulfate reductase
MQWVKTLGRVLPTDDGNVLKIEDSGKEYIIRVKHQEEGYCQIRVSNESTASNILFLKKIRKIFRKSHYCVGCRVCEVNCKYGNLKFDANGGVRISDKCVKCGQCLDIDTGCYVYKSLWLSKGLGNMNKNKSLDCYAAHAPKIEWFQQYAKLGERFKTDNSLGNNQVPAFNRFLRDAGVIDGDVETALGAMLRNNIEDEKVWALMLTNLSYTPEVGWYISNFNANENHSLSSIINELSNTDGVSVSAQKSIPAALKRIAALPFMNVGFGFCEKSTKENGGAVFIRTSWAMPDEKVILYSLYRFAEACGGFYQFTLNRLMDHGVDSDGISPNQIFGIDKDTLTKILKGLTANYPDYINVSFTLDLDNITLKEDKSSKDVLSLF